METSSLSNGSGVLFFISSNRSNIILSWDFPPEEDCLGCILNTVSNKAAPSFCAVIISALSCKPKTTGSLLTGKFSI